MKIQVISGEEYAGLFQHAMHAFNTESFNALNKSKCDETLNILLLEDKVRIGIIFGIKGKTLISPYSAPYGGFTFENKAIRLSYIEEAIKAVELFAREKRFNEIIYSLPPYFYEESILSKLYFSFIQLKYNLYPDLNHHFQTSDIYKYNAGEISHNALMNLQTAKNSGLSFKLVNTDAEKQTVYDIIIKNRLEKNRPMFLSFEYLQMLKDTIPIDYFLVSRQNTPLASAIVYHVAAKIVQIVFWGSISDGNKFRPMNFLSFSIFDYYAQLGGIKFIDLGISCENGIPNYGLCIFKERIGCRASIKYSFSKDLINTNE